MNSQAGRATGLWELYCPDTMTGGLLCWWASAAPGALLHNSLTISQGSWVKVEVKSDSPPVSLNQPPSSHLFIFFIFLFCPLIWTRGSPSKFCHISGSDRTWLRPEVTLLVLVFACWEDEMYSAATHLSSGLGCSGLFWELCEFHITWEDIWQKFEVSGLCRGSPNSVREIQQFNPCSN